MKTPWSDALEYATKNAEEAIRKEKMKMENIACFDILYPGVKAIANKMCWSCERGITSYNFYRKAQTACGRDETRHLNEQEVYDMIREIGGHYIKQDPALWPSIIAVIGMTGIVIFGQGIFKGSADKSRFCP